jgi:DNA polymerase-4
LFIDMNNYFASAEQHLRPELRGRMVGVVPVLSRGTCLIAACKESKRRGARVGTPVAEAERLCPGIALVEARPPVYVDLHHDLARCIDRCVPIHKAYSVDEWAVRLTGPQTDRGAAVALARAVKREMLASFSPWLTCSVGVAPTRLLAKIACDLQKPDGLTVLMPEDMPGRLEHLEPQDLCGISRGIGARLAGHGVRTVRDLWALSRSRSVEVWGSVEGARWWAGFHGDDEPEVRTRTRSMSHANVLEPRFRSVAGARKMLVRLIHRLGIRLRDAGMLAEHLSIDVVPAGEGVRLAMRAAFPQTQSTTVLLRAFYERWADRPPMRTAPIRVGVTVSGLTRVEQADGHLFADFERETTLSHTLDTINRRWGVAAAYFGSMHGCCHHMDEKIAFGRVPSQTFPRSGPACDSGRVASPRE